MRQSIGSDNRDQILKDVESLSLEKYIEEIASAVVEGVGRCKTEKDVWGGTEVSHCPPAFICNLLAASLPGYLCIPSKVSQVFYTHGC